METVISNNLWVFLLFSVFNTLLSFQVPPVFLDHRRRLFRERAWEEGGDVYQRLFRVKQWKNSLPELGDFLRKVFPKKRITSYEPDYLERYIIESCRAELTHWGIILSSFLFALWNGLLRTADLILLALGLNLPYIIIQRYNRPRINSFLTCRNGKRSRPTGRSKSAVQNQLPRSILFVSAEHTGHGHKSIVESLSRQISELDPDIRVSVVDGFSLGNKLWYALGKLYNPLAVNAPVLWGFLYRMGNHFVSLINAAVAILIGKKFRKCLEEVRSDVIVPVHASFVGSVLTILEKENLNIPVIPFIADLDNVSSLWADKRAHCTLCPSPESRRTMLSLGIPEDKLKLVGFPVREDFCDPSPALPKTGDLLTEKGASVLLINGSQGSRQTLQAAQNLLQHSNCRLSIMAGGNASLKKYLERELASYAGGRVRIYGFTKNIKQHMLEADILVVRASPNVLMEAVNLGKPLIVTGALHGQEEKNPDFVVRYNLGVVCRDNARLAETVGELLAQDGQKLQEIYAAQMRFRNCRAAWEIAGFIIGSGRRAAGLQSGTEMPTLPGGNYAGIGK